jgi:AraC-like DNA-binding protein
MVYITHDEPFTFSAHVHPHFEAILMREGQTSVSVDGMERTLQVGDMAVAFPNTVHSFHHFANEGILDIVLCAPQLFKEYRSTLSQYHPTCAFIEKELVHRDVVYAMDSFQTEMKDPDVNACSALLNLILARILPVMTLCKNTESNSFDLAHRAVSYLMANYSEPISLDILADKLGVSNSKLSRVFTNRLKTTFTSFVQQLRIDCAKKLLQSSELSIEDVCYECGFDSLRDFDRVFVKICGHTPRQFRKGIHF